MLQEVYLSVAVRILFSQTQAYKEISDGLSFTLSYMQWQILLAL